MSIPQTIIPLGPDFVNQAESAIDTIHKLFQSGIFEPRNANNPLCDSSFTQLMITLSDLLQKCKLAGFPVNFSDDIEVDPPDLNDITDLVSKFRGSVAHLTSKNRIVKGTRTTIVYVRIFGKGKGIKIGDKVISGDYADDMCFVYGGYKIYLNRHIIRAFNTARQNLEPFSRKSPEFDFQPLIKIGR